VTKGISENYIHVENDESLSSDHTSVIMTISELIVTNKATAPKLTTGKTDWYLFSSLVEVNINLHVPIKDPVQLEEELERFIEIIQRAAWDSTPISYKKGNKEINYPVELRELIKKKRKARKDWQRNRAPENKKILNKLCIKIKSFIKELKNESINRYLQNLTAQKDTEYSLWKATKGIKRPKIQAPPIKNDNGTWARSAKQKADLFAAYLEETFRPLPKQTDEENIYPINKCDDLEITPVTLQELKNEIKGNINAKKAPGYDLITGQIVKALPEKGLRKLLYLINASLRMKYVPLQWKVAEVIMILKPDKPPNDRKSYRPISLLPIISKLFEKLLLKRLKPIIEDRNLIPDHQFGFRQRHSTIDQVHRITNIIENALENKKICASIFLDVAQAFDKVWHKGLEWKLQRDLPKQYYKILKSYMTDRHFRVKCEGEYSELKKISAGVPQGSVLGPVLYLLYTRDLPTVEDATIATFADDTAILATGNKIEEAAVKLQRASDAVNKWTKKWRIRLNEMKSVNVNFTNQKIDHRVPIIINSLPIPHANSAKYLGMTLDAKLRWKEHVKKKKQELNLKFRKMYWLLGRQSQLSIHNKLLLYKQVLKPVWIYGIQLWGCAKKTNVSIIQTFQNKVLRCIVDAPWYVRNDNLHRDLKMELVSEEIKKQAVKHGQRVLQHVHTEIRQLLDTTSAVRRLRRTKPLDLMDIS
jgi:hypothetical protein